MKVWYDWCLSRHHRHNAWTNNPNILCYFIWTTDMVSLLFVCRGALTLYYDIMVRSHHAIPWFIAQYIAQYVERCIAYVCFEAYNVWATIIACYIANIPCNILTNMLKHIHASNHTCAIHRSTSWPICCAKYCVIYLSIAIE